MYWNLMVHRCYQLIMTNSQFQTSTLSMLSKIKLNFRCIWPNGINVQVLLVVCLFDSSIAFNFKWKFFLKTLFFHHQIFSIFIIESTQETNGETINWLKHIWLMFATRSLPMPYKLLVAEAEFIAEHTTKKLVVNAKMLQNNEEIVQIKRIIIARQHLKRC